MSRYAAPRPLVSVLIRSAARPELAIALQSMASQSWQNIELLVVDVKGGLEARLQDLAGDVPVRVLGTGQALTRSEAANVLLEHATGELALFLDDDDWVSPSHVGTLVDFLQANPQAVMACSGTACVKVLDDTGGGLPLWMLEADSPCFEVVRRYEEPFDPLRLLVENNFPIHAVMFRMEAVRQAPSLRFDPQLDIFEDWDFWIALSQRGGAVGHQELTAFYRIHDTGGIGVTHDDQSKATDMLELIINKWLNPASLKTKAEMVGLMRQAYALKRELQIRDRQLQSRELELIGVLAEQSQTKGRIEELQASLAASHDRLAQATAQRESLEAALEQERQHGAEATRLLDSILASKSWRYTRLPSRAYGLVQSWLARVDRDRLAHLKTRLFRGLLNLATTLYRAPWMQGLMSRVPFAWKQRIRQGLMARSQSARPVTEAKGLGESASQGPEVSIIIPVYNHARYIRACIESALAQTFENLEVVVVNDASPDPEVRTILDSLEGRPRLKILHHAVNQGICEAQNTALIASTGRIVAFLDCDDYLMPESIEVCMRHWASDTVYLHTGRINVDEKNQEVNRIHFLSLPRQDYFSENLNRMFATHLKLIHRSAFAKVGLFDPRFDSAQDYDMLMRIAFHYPSSSFVHVPDFLYCHRLHGDQTTEKQRGKQDWSTSQIQKEARLREGISQGRFDRFVSIIMLSFGKEEQTLKAIEGLQRTVKIPHEVILYDNGSAEKTVQFLKSRIEGRFEQVKVHYGERNLGPALGRREAMKLAKGDWFIVFDNDEVPEPGWIEELLVRGQAYDNVGAVCCRVVFPDGMLQFSGGQVLPHPMPGFEAHAVIDLGLYDRGAHHQSLESCRFREVDWSPIGATLFTRNITDLLHDGYPNCFEDAGVSHALKRQGLRLLNSPGSLVWHDHITFQKVDESLEKYVKDRYNPRLMMKSVNSFYRENGQLIFDEYIWRENGLLKLKPDQVIEKVQQARSVDTVF